MQGFERSVGEIVESVWQSLFEVGVAEEDPFRLSLAKGKNLAGQVRITGAWEGIVGFQCSEKVAREHVRGQLQGSSAGALQPLDPDRDSDHRVSASGPRSHPGSSLPVPKRR